MKTNYKTNILKDIQYIKPNVGYFPNLPSNIIHGFSWGNQKNMQFSLGDFIQTRQNVQEFYDSLGLGNFRDSILMLPEHKDNIITIDKLNLNSFNKTRFGISVSADTIFTREHNLAISVKPADCTTAIIYAKDKSLESISGLVHSGRRGVELFLPEKSISYLIANFDLELKDIFVCIVPHLFLLNRKFENIDQLNYDVWKDFIRKEDNYYLVGETEFAIHQYIKAGIPESNITIYDVDTYEAAKNGLTFSYKYHYEMERIGISVPDGRNIVVTCIK